MLQLGAIGINQPNQTNQGSISGRRATVEEEEEEEEGEEEERGLVAIYCKNHAKPINTSTLCGQNVEILGVKAAAVHTYIYEYV
jgi:hypothetical protein